MAFDPRRLLVSCALLALSADAATFQKRYYWPGDDVALGVAVRPEGGFLVPSRCVPDSGPGVVRVLRLSSDGDTLWTRGSAIPGGSFLSHTFEPGSAGGGIVVGRVKRERVDWDNCVLALDSTGAMIWWNSWGSAANELLTGGLRLADGWLVCGVTQESGEDDVRLDWLDDSGRVTRTVILAEPGPQVPFDLAWSWDSSLLLAVNELPGGGQYSSVTLRKLDTTGRAVWSRRFDDSLWDEGRALASRPDGGTAIAGFSSTLTHGMQGLLVRADSTGQVSWYRQYGFDGSDRFFAVGAVPSGGVVLAGESYPRGGGSSDLYLVRVDAGGAMSWERLIGGDADDFGCAVACLADSGYVIAGGSGAGGERDVYVVRTDAAGVVGVADGAGPQLPPVRSTLFSDMVRLPAGTEGLTILSADGRVVAAAEPGGLWTGPAAGVYLVCDRGRVVARLVKLGGQSR